MTGKTRREMSDLVNMVLGTGIDYTKLSKEGLATLYNKCQDPRALMIQIGSAAAAHRIGGIAQGLLANLMAPQE